MDVIRASTRRMSGGRGCRRYSSTTKSTSQHEIYDRNVDARPLTDMISVLCSVVNLRMWPGPFLASFSPWASSPQIEKKTWRLNSCATRMGVIVLRQGEKEPGSELVDVDDLKLDSNVGLTLDKSTAVIDSHPASSPSH